MHSTMLMSKLPTSMSGFHPKRTLGLVASLCRARGRMYLGSPFATAMVPQQTLNRRSATDAFAANLQHCWDSAAHLSIHR